MGVELFVFGHVYIYNMDVTRTFWCRQLSSGNHTSSRPYLFSNSLAPAIVNASIKVLEMLDNGQELRDRVKANAEYFRSEMAEAGFTMSGADHAIVPVMLGDAKLAQEMSNKLLAKGIYVIGFSFPVVPKGAARIRTQMSAAHTKEQLDRAISAFIEVGKELKVI